MAMEPMALKPELRKRAAQAVAAAFYDYPSFRHYFPDPALRARVLPRYMERILHCAQIFGGVWATADAAGVLFFLPPGHTRMSDWDYVRGGMLAASLKVGLRRYRSLADMRADGERLAHAQERLLAGRPHYYLWGLAVDPSKQGGGVGTALLEVFLQKTDGEKLPVYLETHREANVPYYEKRGFKRIGTEGLSEHSLAFWCMLHEPEDN
ncbi:MAG: GNAT family N-acetyltransferase [Clostridiales bacterium]|nr:GNAT family N-acetyltransferase [Clostridiales bacterium]